ncbi:MAG TPA: hypothetical protein PLZ74_07730, partial [Kiritimatiellia bacterium]|nr:hypothetical protein [Kiritimatiellia bacterium]
MSDLRQSLFKLLTATAFCLLSSGVFPLSAQQYSQEDIANRHTIAFPNQRLQRDWVYQDLGSLDVKNVFTSKEANAQEKKLLGSVLRDLKALGLSAAAGKIEKTFAALAGAGKPGADPAWQNLYFQACGVRRKERLARAFKDQPRTFIYAKHF